MGASTAGGDVAGLEPWPALPLDAWEDTRTTLHVWTQIVGKIRLVQSPLVNHWWQVPLYVTPRGLTTSIIPHGTRSFEISFDFIDHELLIQTGARAITLVMPSPVWMSSLWSTSTRS